MSPGLWGFSAEVVEIARGCGFIQMFGSVSRLLKFPFKSNFQQGQAAYRAKLNVEYYYVHAPFDGYVTNLNIAEP